MTHWKTDSQYIYIRINRYTDSWYWFYTTIGRRSIKSWLFHMFMVDVCGLYIQMKSIFLLGPCPLELTTRVLLWTCNECSPWPLAIFCISFVPMFIKALASPYNYLLQRLKVKCILYVISWAKYIWWL